MSEPIGQNMTASEVSPPRTPTQKRTKTWMVYAKDDTLLGLVHYRQTWRCYVFAPARDTEFDSACLCDLQAFIIAKNVEQKADALRRRMETQARNR